MACLGWRWVLVAPCPWPGRSDATRAVLVPQGDHTGGVRVNGPGTKAAIDGQGREGYDWCMACSSWGKLGLCALLLLVVAAVACDSEVEESSECPADVAARLARIEAQGVAATGSLQDAVDEIAAALTQACSSIASDLGETVPDPSGVDTLTYVNAVCGLAESAIAARINSGATVDLEATTEGQCVPDDDAGAQCMQACANDPLCAGICDGIAVFEGQCSPPIIVVTSPDPELADTLQANYPTIVWSSGRVNLITKDHADEKACSVIMVDLSNLASEHGCELSAAVLATGTACFEAAADLHALLSATVAFLGSAGS